MKLKSEDVFRLGTFLEYTYISRKSAVSDLSYEFRLNQVIKVSGAAFDEDTDFWKVVSAKVGVTYEGQFSSEKTKFLFL